MQLDRGHKGFSFSKSAPLDMRMDPTLSVSAKEIVNTWSEEKLGKLFHELGEEPRWKRAAQAIVDYRRSRKFQTTTELADLIASVLSPLRGKWHPATLIFQALRICVNRELEVISEGICQAIDFLAPGGRIGVISFHSLEDRIVKNLFRQAATVPREERKRGNIPFKIITKKPVVPSLEEVRKNPRARSAKLRILERL